MKIILFSIFIIILTTVRVECDQQKFINSHTRDHFEEEFD